VNTRPVDLKRHALLAVAMVAALGACGKASTPPAQPAAGLPTTLGAAWGTQLEQLPDWTGAWFINGCCTFPGRDFAVAAVDPAARGTGGFTYGELPGSYFKGAPYKPEYQKVYDERVRMAREQFKVYDPMSSCMVPHGMPRIIGGGPGPTEFLVTPEQTTIIWDYMNEMRRVYTDGRPHPPATEYPPSIMGHSIGHWEGDTLVVDTRLIKAGIYDRSGAPHSDQVHLLERIRRLDAKSMEFDVTIDDPVMFTGPWKVRRVYFAWPNSALEGAYCENNRNPVTEDGQSAVLGSEQ
jgi:hypothetical protein